MRGARKMVRGLGAVAPAGFVAFTAVFMAGAGRSAAAQSPRQAADAALIAQLRASSPEWSGDTLHVYSPADEASDMAGRQLDPDWERFFRPFYPALSDPSAHVFAVGWLSMGPGLSGYVLRVPGQYAPAAMALWIHNDRDGYWLTPLTIADSGIDGTWSFQRDAWLLDRTGDGYRDLVVHSTEWDTDSFPVPPDYVIADSLSWRSFDASASEWGMERAPMREDPQTFILVGGP